MTSLFDPNGALMNSLRKLSDIILCNLLFCVFSLPVLTAGAALTALHTSMQMLARDEESDDKGNSVVKVFVLTFRRDFISSTNLWLVTLLMIFLLFIYHQVIWSMSGPLARAYRVTFYVVLLVFAFGAQYFFPLRARYKLSLKGILVNSWLLSLAAAPMTILSLVIGGGAVFVSFLMNPEVAMQAAFLWAAAGFGIVTYLESFCFLRAFRKLGDMQEAEMREDSHQTEGNLFTDEDHRKDEFDYRMNSISNPDWNRKTDPEEDDRKQKHNRDFCGRRKGNRI